jgi:sulfite reductase beta subunit-like hemoprotein
LTAEADSRSSLAYNALIDVAVRYKFAAATQIYATQEIDLTYIEEYVDLLEAIAEHLATPGNRALTAKTDATWLRNEMRAPWVPEHIREHRQYTGIVRATYYVAKDL